MPPKRKQSAATNKGGSSAKKAKKVVDPLQEKVELIVDAINTHHEEVDIQELLVSAAKKSFEDPQDKRHKFHDECIKMIDTSLKKYIADFDTKVAETRAKVNSADDTKAQNIENRNRTGEKLEQQNELIVQKQEELRAKEEHQKNAAKELKAKKADKLKACGPLLKLEAELEECHQKEGVYKELRDNIAELSAIQKKQSIKVLTPYLKKLNVDSSLVVSAPHVLEKAERGGFDVQILAAIEEQFKKFISDLNQQIEEQKNANREVIDKVEAAEQQLSTAKTSTETASSELEALEGVKSELEASKKKADKDIKDHDKHVKAYVSELTGFTETYESLLKVHETMCELRDRRSEKHEVAEVPVEEERTESHI